MAKVLIPLGKGFEELEAITIIDVLRRVGCEVVVASLNDSLEVISQGGIKVIADASLREINRSSLDAVVFPGGWEGTQNLIASGELKEIVLKLHSDCKIIAAICAAPLALFKMGVLENCDFTCYPSIEKNIENINYKKDKNVIQSGHIITSKGPATALEFAFYLAEILASKQKAQEIKEGMLAS